MKNCDDCTFMFRTCGHKDSPNFLMFREFCDELCEFFQEKPDGMKPVEKTEKEDD